MKQPNDITRLRINARQIRPLVQVALRASQSEIIGIVAAAMLARDDVLDVKTQLGKLLRQSAVFAQIGGPRADKLTEQSDRIPDDDHASRLADCRLPLTASAHDRARTCPPLPEERGPRKKAAPDFTLYAPLRAEQTRSNTSRASAIDSKDGCGFRPALDPLPE
jgi:hypothetical protein